MKKVFILFLIFLLAGCSSFNLTDSIKKVKFNLVDVKSVKFCDVNFKDKIRYSSLDLKNININKI